MTTTLEEMTNEYSGKVGVIPSFSGEDIDYEMWREDDHVWEYHTTVGQKFKGAKLYGAQQNKEVKDVMRAVGMSVIKSEEGYEKIMAAMDAHYRMEYASSDEQGDDGIKIGSLDDDESEQEDDGIYFDLK